MTYDEFLDREKKRGHIIYVCQAKGCTYRGYGTSVIAHEISNPSHMCICEDEILDLDKMPTSNKI